MIYALILLLVCAAILIVVKRRQREKNKPAIVMHAAVPPKQQRPDKVLTSTGPHAKAERAAEAAAGYTVLIADDQPLIRAMLSEMLQQDGIQVIEAANGMDAVTAVQEHSIDLVLLDMNMPGLNGMEALKSIRSLNARVEVAFMTGSVEPGLRAKAEHFGAGTFFTKPFDLEIVKAHVINCRDTVKYKNSEGS